MGFVRNLTRRSEVERDLDDELQAYIDLLTAEKIKLGMTPDAARRAAHLEAGGVEQIKEEVRDVRRGAFLETTLQDFRYGLRLLRRSPGFAILAIVTIGLGIGANSAIFSVINGVVRKPLGYPQSDRLMFITSAFRNMKFDRFWVSPPEYHEFKEQTKSFSHVGAYTTGAWNVAAGDQPERVNAVFMTASMFDVLGVKPDRGQTFTAEQDLPNVEPVVVIGNELWQRMFGGDPAIVGKRVDIQGRQRTIIGVMPRGFDLHDARAQLWVPLGLDPTNRAQQRGSHFLYLVGRLAPGISPQQATGDLQTMLRNWGQVVSQQHVPNDSTHRMNITPLRDDVVGNVRKALWVLQGAVLLVLLIACANVANLLLARAETRHKEFAVRTALGAGRGRILRQFMAEGVVLSVLGGILGLALAYWGLQALLAANPQSIPRAAEISLDPAVLAFTFAVAVGTGLIFGLAPLLHMNDKAVTLAIKEGGVRTTSNAGRNRMRRGLVVAEIALAVMLVIGAGLLIRSFDKLTSVDAGFDPANRVTFGVVMPPAAYPDSQRRVAFHAELKRKLQAIPGVDAVAAMQGLPPFRQINANDTQFEGYNFVPNTNMPIPNTDYYQTVTAGYFAAMGIGVKDGRVFNEGDAAGAPVVVINEALANRFYPDQNPIGRRLNPFLTPGPEPTWFTIVGIVKDVKQGGLESPAGTELYFFYDQLPRIAGFAPSQMNIIMKSSRPLEALAPGIRQAVREMDPTLPIVQLRTMEEVVGASVTRQRFLSLLLGIFALVALTLAAIGTYGILSYMVTERHREIGIRMALGAGNGQVVGLVLGQGLGIAAVGIALGIGGAMALSQLTSSLLYGVSPSDPVTYVSVALVIAVVAIAACVVPTRRATRVDPLEAIRAD
ncbi:MAG TPA: ABC transporter permease [Gemmatimonadaceae bacterium]|nr:ABC transporter permease [Gemmatimonadaceae bacterium]